MIKQVRLPSLEDYKCFFYQTFLADSSDAAKLRSDLFKGPSTFLQDHFDRHQRQDGHIFIMTMLTRHLLATRAPVQNNLKGSARSRFSAVYEIVQQMTPHAFGALLAWMGRKNEQDIQIVEKGNHGDPTSGAPVKIPPQNTPPVKAKQAESGISKAVPTNLRLRHNASGKRGRIADLCVEWMRKNHKTGNVKILAQVVEAREKVYPGSIESTIYLILLKDNRVVPVGDGDFDLKTTG